MNIKSNKNGITLVILAITITIMLILFGVTFSTADDLLRNTQKNKMKTMLYLVQSRAQILLEDFLFDNDGKSAQSLKEINSDSLGGSESKESELEKVEYSEGAMYIYKTWDEATLKSQGIDTKNLAEGDTIVIQYDIVHNEVDVASSKGIMEDEGGIHKLKEFSD